MSLKLQTQLAPRHSYIMHIARNTFLGVLMVAVALFVGMLGYHTFEHMSWIDSYANAAMILSGMGPFGPLSTTAGKIFAGIYALFSGLTFIFIMGLMFSPVVHRLFHQWHIELYDDGKEKK